MYLRIPREPIDDWADAIWAAATRCDAPMVPPIPPQHLGMVYLPEKQQIEKYGLELDRLGLMGNSIRARREAGILRHELLRCRSLIVVTSNFDLRLASNRSAEPYELFERVYQRYAAHYENLVEVAALSLGDLGSIPQSEQTWRKSA